MDIRIHDKAAVGHRNSFMPGICPGMILAFAVILPLLLPAVSRMIYHIRESSLILLQSMLTGCLNLLK